VARLHCLQALFPEWAGDDMFLLKQLKDSIEISLQQDPREDTFEKFSDIAEDLRRQTPGSLPVSHAFISLDFSEKTWDPLFARQEIIRHLKRHAGTDHIFLLIRGLRHALFPKARYRTKAREAAHEEATRFIDELARHWSTSSSKIHLLYI
jgi:hypothetical protein